MAYTYVRTRILNPTIHEFLFLFYQLEKNLCEDSLVSCISVFLGIHGILCIVGKRKGRPPGSKYKPKTMTPSNTASTSAVATTSFCVAATKAAPVISSEPPTPQTSMPKSAEPTSAEPEIPELEESDDQVIQNFSQFYFDHS